MKSKLDEIDKKLITLYRIINDGSSSPNQTIYSLDTLSELYKEREKLIEENTELSDVTSSYLSEEMLYKIRNIAYYQEKINSIKKKSA